MCKSNINRWADEKLNLQNTLRSCSERCEHVGSGLYIHVSRCNTESFPRSPARTYIVILIFNLKEPRRNQYNPKQQQQKAKLCYRNKWHRYRQEVWASGLYRWWLDGTNCDGRLHSCSPNSKLLPTSHRIYESSTTTQHFLQTRTHNTQLASSLLAENFLESKTLCTRPLQWT